VKLLPTLRYAHGEAYVRTALDEASLAVACLEKTPVRTEKGLPVDSLVVVAQQNTAHFRESGNPVPMERQ
jgi:predicted TPR repeat methyltransferase